MPIGIKQSPYCDRVYILIRRDGPYPNKYRVCQMLRAMQGSKVS